MSTAGDHIEKLREKLAGVRAADYDLRIHGATQHGHRFDRADSSRIEEIESAINGNLPQEYRSFLLNVGYGGGPDYGLFSPRRILEEALWYNEGNEDEASNGKEDVVDFSHLTPDTLASCAAALASKQRTHLIGVSSRRHTATIAEHGCGHDYHLILRGPLAGRVMLNTALPGPFYGFWSGLGSADHSGSAPTFFSWLEHWIDVDCARQIEQRYKKK